jgi:putative ABC transport system permease protein
VALCRLLQKNKRYYYKANHFVSVSSMGYRMKRNGASLASICILCTMVLVMLMSTGCLYMGMEGSLRERYARNIMFDISAKDLGVSDSEYAEGLRGVVEKSAKDRGETVKNVLDYSIVDFGGYVMGDEVYLDSKEIQFQANTWQMFVFSLEDYNRLAGADETLGADEALCHVSKTNYDYDTVTLGNEAQLKTWNIKKQVGKFVDIGADASQIMPSMFLVVADVEEALAPWLYDMAEEGGQEMRRHWIYGVDIPCGDEKQKAIFNDMLENIGAMNERVMNEDGGLPFVTYVSECVAMERTSFYELYGGLFFLGIMLGLVFILAAVLMMYYKQLSEGYEDQARFEIMQKVGMTARQIKKSINSQVLTVFFLPLLVAALHLAFAFPLVYKMLLLLGFSNQNLLVFVTVGCVLVFALFYILVYNVTSRAYYKIVSPVSSSGRSSR